MKKILIVLGLFFFAASALTFADGSLAEAAKKEKERRAKITKPAKVITNKDIEEFKASGKVAAGTIENTTPEGESGTPAATEDQNAYPEPPPVDQQQWVDNLSSARDKVEAAQERVKQLESRAAANLYDPGMGQLTGQAGNDASELSDAKQALSDAQAELEALQDQARQAGASVPR